MKSILFIASLLSACPMTVNAASARPVRADLCASVSPVLEFGSSVLMYTLDALGGDI